MDHNIISRVMNFLDNGIYEENTIEQDIIKVIQYSNNYNNDPLMDELIKKVRSLVYKREDEILIFSNIINQNLYSEYKKLLLYKYLPFKDSKNIKLECLLFLGTEKKEYIDLINYFMSSNIKQDISLDSKIKHFIEEEKIKLDSFEHDYKIGGYKENGSKTNNYPNTNEEMLNEFKQIKEKINDSSLKKSDEKYTNALGHYAELIIYEQELAKVKNDPNSEVMWISKDVGDGFGYDILVVNHVTNSLKFIEVKGTTSGEIVDVNLSDNEYKVMKKITNDSKNYDVSYHVSIVSNYGDKEDIINIRYDENKNKNIEENEYEYLIFSNSEREKNINLIKYKKK